ncbi:MAG: hypothetical protein J6N72_04070 [Psychrobacter sp.]|nr:hypothetical protein [Psychrobacter sp.]
MKNQTIANTQENFLVFLESLVSCRIKPEITNAVIAQFGGWQNFTDSSMDLFVFGGTLKDKKRQSWVKGWESQEVMSAFYTNNKLEILELAKSRTDTQQSQTVVELVADFYWLEQEYDLDDVAAGMHMPDCTEYLAISTALTRFTIKEISYAYNNFKSINGNHAIG